MEKVLRKINVTVNGVTCFGGKYGEEDNNLTVFIESDKKDYILNLRKFKNERSFLTELKFDSEGRLIETNYYEINGSEYVQVHQDKNLDVALEYSDEISKIMKTHTRVQQKISRNPIFNTLRENRLEERLKKHLPQTQ